MKLSRSLGDMLRKEEEFFLEPRETIYILASINVFVH